MRKIVYILLLLCLVSCKAKKTIVKTENYDSVRVEQSAQVQVIDTSKTHEDYTEIVYVLDSATSVNVTEDLPIADIKVKEIKVKKSHVTRDNAINIETNTNEEKTIVSEEKTQINEKEKSKTTNGLYIIFIIFALCVSLYVVGMFIKDNS